MANIGNKRIDESLAEIDKTYDLLADQIIKLVKESLPKKKTNADINHDFNDGYKYGFNEALTELKNLLTHNKKI